MQTFHNRPVLQAWQTAVQEETRSRPWLTSFLLRQSPHLFTRFADYYRQLLATPRKVRRQLGTGLATAALLLALSNSPAHAATLTVSPGAAGINGGDGCSLVEAIINANDDAATHADCTAGSGDDTIVLAGNTYSYTAAFGTASALPNIATPITIEGNGATIARTGGSPNFRILNVAGTGNLTLNEATITGGVASGGAPAQRGGGIYIALGGTATINNSTLSGNTATVLGGGLFNYGMLTINNSTISGNTSQQRGGGVYTIHGTAIINNSTISGNTAQRGGGVTSSFYGTVTINHSTISGNTAQVGGGVYHWQSTAAINNSTISGNTANYGGGFFNGYYGVATLRRTIVSGNSAPTGAEVNRYYGTINNNNHNIFGHSGLTNAQAFSGFTPSGTDVTATSNGTTPTALASILNTTLANNGGPTLTHALVTGSPAIDRAPTGSAGLIDQRGAVRDFDGNGSASANEADAGAVEFRQRITQGTCGSADLAGVQTFAFASGTTVSVDVNTAAGLNCINVEEMGTNHLAATGSIGNPGIHTGNWWHISGNINSGFDVDVTLPFAGADADSRVCKWPGNIGGQGWDCGDDTDNTEGAGVVTRTGLGSFSDWAVGDTVDPTAVTNLLTQTTSQPPTTILALLATLLAAFSGARLWRRR